MSLFSIVLNKDSTNGADPANSCCPFNFGSVMGQEDRFREDPPGTRVNNTLIARIVWATTVPATSRVLWGVGGLDNDTGVVATDKVFHEVFFEVSEVNTTYQFQVISTSTVCDPNGETLQSGTYYFEVGGEIALSDSSIVFTIGDDIVPFSGLSYTFEDVVTFTEGDYGSAGTADPMEQSYTFAPVGIDYTEQKGIGNNELYTSYVTAVT